jgi:hypothetical protein
LTLDGCIKAVETGSAKGLLPLNTFKKWTWHSNPWATHVKYLNEKIHGLVESYWVSWQKVSEHQFDAQNLMGTFLSC